MRQERLAIRGGLSAMIVIVPTGGEFVRCGVVFFNRKESE